MGPRIYIILYVHMPLCVPLNLGGWGYCAVRYIVVQCSVEQSVAGAGGRSAAQQRRLYI